MSLADMDIDNLLKTGSERSTRRRRLEGSLAAAVGSSDGQELKEIVVAMAELQIADAKLGLQNDHLLRSHAGAVESVFIIDSTHSVPRAMKAAKVPIHQVRWSCYIQTVCRLRRGQ